MKKNILNEIESILKQENTSLNDNKFFVTADYTPILNVTFPILFTFTSNNVLMVGYVTKFKRRSKILEFLLTKTSFDNILDLLEKKISINDLYNTDETIIYIKSSKSDTKVNSIPKLQTDLQKDLQKEIFTEKLFLNNLLPNTIDKKYVYTKFQIQKNKYIKIKKNYFDFPKKDFSLKHNYNDSDSTLNLTTAIRRTEPDNFIIYKKNNSVSQPIIFNSKKHSLEDALNFKNIDLKEYSITQEER